MDFKSSFLLQQSQRIVTCYAATLGSSLLERMGLSAELEGAPLAEALFYSRCAILSHDRVINGDRWDNIYNYANKAALDIFERSFEEQTALPSSRSAADGNPQSDRNNLLAECLTKGQVIFSTTRQSASGKTVPLEDAILFNLFDSVGIYAGQAVVFDVP